MAMLSASVSQRRLPVNLEDGDLYLFQHELRQEIPPTSVHTFRNVRVNCEGLIFKRSRILPESFTSGLAGKGHKSCRDFLAFLVRNYLQRERVDIAEPGIWFVNNWSRNYFHWMTDALPRLFSALDLVPTSHVVLPGNYQRLEYVASSLRALGISPLMFVPEHQVACFKELLLPGETAITGNYNEELIDQIREAFRRSLFRQNSSLQLGERIYVSRSRASRRQILNEDAVIGILQRHGFRKMHFEELSFNEQANVCLNAKYLIANHGAGLTNMLFMNPGGCVLEMRKKADAQNNCYFSLASALGLQYFYQTCPSDTPEKDSNSANIIVDVSKLQENVELMLAWHP